MSRGGTLGTREIDATRPPVIWDYVRRDVPGAEELRAELARYFVEQIRQHASQPAAALQDQRNQHGCS